MPDLEQVDDRHDRAGDERSLDGRLGVAGEKGRKAAVAQDHHDRAVVDVALGKRRNGVRIGRVQDLEGRGGIQGVGLPRAGKRDIQRRLRGCVGKQVVMRGVLEGDPRVKEGADLESVEGLDQPRNVVLVRVAEHHEVNASRVERQICTDSTQGDLWIRTAVDEHRRAGRRLDQDRVALADVEDGHVQEPVGPRRDGDDDQHDQEPAADGQRPEDASSDIRGTTAGRLRLGGRPLAIRPERP